MKTQIISTEQIQETAFSLGATVLTLDQIPNNEEQNQLFGNDENIVLEF